MSDATTAPPETNFSAVLSNYTAGGWIALVCLIPMAAMWLFMIFGFFGIGYALKGKNAGRETPNMMPIKLQFLNFTFSVAACLMEAVRRLLGIGSQSIIDNCMGLTISFVFFYCAAKWSTYSFLMTKILIASKGEKSDVFVKKKRMLQVMSALLALTCIAIVAVSRGSMFRDSGMCLWILESLLIAFLYPAGDALLSFYLMYAFVKPLRDSARKTNSDMLNAIIKENVQVGTGCVISSFVIHVAVGIGVKSKLRVQLITEALVCLDLVCNAIGLLYSTRRSWVRVKDGVEMATVPSQGASAAPGGSTNGDQMSPRLSSRVSARAGEL